MHFFSKSVCGGCDQEGQCIKQSIKMNEYVSEWENDWTNKWMSTSVGATPSFCLVIAIINIWMAMGGTSRTCPNFFHFHDFQWNDFSNSSHHRGDEGWTNDNHRIGGKLWVFPGNNVYFRWLEKVHANLERHATFQRRIDRNIFKNKLTNYNTLLLKVIIAFNKNNKTCL